MIGEVGEVIDIIKKNGHEKSMGPLREDLVEELTDVLMYYNDILPSDGITPQELKESYFKNYHRNMARW